MARIAFSKYVLVNDPDLTPMRMVMYYSGAGRFKQLSPIGNFNVYDVQSIESQELKYAFNNWDDVKLDTLDVWAEVPASALDSNVPDGFPDRLIYDDEGVAIGIKTWLERSNSIIKHDDALSAVMSMSPKDSFDNNLVNGNTRAVVKQFLDLVDGLANRTIDHCHSGKDIAVIKAVYNPPVEEE